MIGWSSQKGEIFALSKLEKLYVDPTPLSNMSLMVQSEFWSEQEIYKRPRGGNL